LTERIVTPPGSTLLETIEALGMTQAELAQRMGRPVKTVNEIINGKASITPDTALQLERVLNVPAHFWRRREENYQQYLLSLKDTDELNEQLDWLSQIPFAELVKRGWVKEGASPAERVKSALEFFGVASAKAWTHVWTSPDALYRQSPAFAADPGAVAAWLRKGEIEARSIHCERYRKPRFESALKQIRSLTTKEPGAAIEQAKQLCSSSGVALVFVEELPGCRASGATRWLNRHKAVIQLSFRYRTNDHLWFTLLHEAGHLLLTPEEKAFVDEPSSLSSTDPREAQANEFAANLLIPRDDYDQFVNGMGTRRPTSAIIREFADSIGIHPGIVVGRLQHDGLVPYGSSLNHLKCAVQ
jgi:HTH-type transcriptional regulator/antitoxin HigA